MTFTEKYEPCDGINFPVDIVGLGVVDLSQHPIEVVDNWFKLGKLKGVIRPKKTATPIVDK